MDEPKSKTLDMIGNAHLDLVWLWQWQEGLQEIKATFRSVLDLMQEYDDFLFTSSSAAMYEWVESSDPAMFEEIKARVAEGRWEIVGGWWVQPDCNLPSGESFVRQGLYGQRFFKEKLGVVASVGYNVDSFGHAITLPQILSKSGLTSYVFTRPHPHEQRLPSRLFWWQSPDGSRVLAYRIPYEYNTWGKGMELHVERCAAELHDRLHELMCFYGVGNHGGGPTRENLDSIREMNGDARYPRLLFSTPSRYFSRVEGLADALPVVHDELQHHATGCYSAHSGVKRWNRQAENLLVAAEKISACAERIVGVPYPRDLQRGWKDVLFNQFHDIVAGSSIEPAYDDARNLYGEAMAIAGRALNAAIQGLSWKIDIPRQEGTRPIAVFNPHAWPVRANVELEFARVDEHDLLLDAEGRQVPLQKVTSLATVSSGSRTRLSFVADLPSLGHALYWIVRSAEAEQPAPMDADPYRLENEHLRLEINPDTGCLRSLYDKRESFEWLAGDAARGLVLRDESDTWGHGVLRYDDVVGEFTARSVDLLECGPVRSVVRVRSEYERSTLTQDFLLYRDLDRVEVRVTVDWREQLKMLKLSFPLNLFYSTATYEVPYGFIERPGNGEEEPGGSWVDLTGLGRGSGRRMGLSLLNDAKYSYDVREGEIRLTVLRSPIYAHHVPYRIEPHRQYSFMDQGLQRFSYVLLPHLGGWQSAGTPRRAAELNAPPIALPETFHRGPLPPVESYLGVDRDNVAVVVVKRPEDGDGLILRCVETHGVPARATIRLPRWHRTIEADFAPCEIKTLLVPSDPELPAKETNLIEWES